MASGKFLKYKTVRTDRAGRFNVRIFQAGTKKTCFRVQVPATEVYSRTTSANIGCIESD